ncbi:MAG: ROK family protein [Candidatus Nanohaloarchaeota archaeon]|nr:ROK family protein [Candidatus Nanohaloarchaeota archaeon]
MDVIFDIGGTKIKYIVVDEKDQIIAERTEPSQQKNPLFLIKEVLLEAKSQYNIKKVYYSVAGQVWNNKVINSPNLGQLDNVNLRDFTHKILNDKAVEVKAANDANCFALGSYFVVSSSIPHLLNSYLVGIVWGTGVGSGIIINKKALEGKNGTAGELGHIKLNHHYKCGCGKTGCLEGAIGGKNLEKRLGIDAKNLIEQHLRLFENETLNWLSQGLEKIIHLLNPAVITFGGSIGENLPERYVEKLINKTQQLLSFNIDFPRIIPVNTQTAVIKGCKHYEKL